MNKEVAKAAKRFGDAFDEKQFRETNPRVLANQEKWNNLHKRFSDALNDNDLAELKKIIEDEGIVCPISGSRNWTDVRQFKPDVFYRNGIDCRRSFKNLPSPRNSAGNFCELPERAKNRTYENSVWNCPNW